MKLTKRGIFQQKTIKITPSWSNQFWNPIALQYEKTSLQKPDKRMKKTQSYKRRNYFRQINEEKEKLYTISFIYV